MPLPPNVINACYTESTVPGYRGNPFIEALPPLLTTKGVKKGLTSKVSLESKDLFADGTSRAHMITGLMHGYFQPLTPHINLEQKLSLLIRQGYMGRNYEDGALNRHLQAGYERLQKGDIEVQTFNQARSTATSFALIGGSGCGKSATLDRLLSTYPQVLFHEELNITQLVYLKIDSPHDGTLKSLCLHFFRAIDQALRSDYESRYGNKRLSIENLMAAMAQTANVHALGVLVIDEIQHLNTAHSGGKDKMLNFFVTLVNTIGVPVLLVGTPKAQPIFVADFRAARRTTGYGAVFWGPMKGHPEKHNESERREWIAFTNKLWKYQWLQKREEDLSDEIRDAWFDLSQGIHDIVVKLFIFAQLRAIATKTERITVQLLHQVYKDELKPVHPMLEALRRDDVKKITEYSDLYVEDAEKRLLDLIQRIDKEASNSPRRKTTYSGNSDAQHLHNMLESMGIPADRSQELVEEAFSLYPDAKLSDLMPIVLEWYKEQPKQQKRATKRKTYVQKAAWNELETEDLRFQHSQSSPEEPMYEMLRRRHMVFDLAEWLTD